MVIAPLDANTMAKMAHGLCDNLLVSVGSCLKIFQGHFTCSSTDDLAFHWPCTQIFNDFNKHAQYILTPNLSSFRVYTLLYMCESALKNFHFRSARIHCMCPLCWWSDVCGSSLGAYKDTAVLPGNEHSHVETPSHRETQNRAISAGVHWSASCFKDTGLWWWR